MKTIVEIGFCVIELEKEIKIESNHFNHICLGFDYGVEDMVGNSWSEIEDELIHLLKDKELAYDKGYRAVMEVEFKSTSSFDGECTEWDTEIICSLLHFDHIMDLPPSKIIGVNSDSIFTFYSDQDNKTKKS